jgi:hypothetical protein
LQQIQAATNKWKKHKAKNDSNKRGPHQRFDKGSSWPKILTSIALMNFRKPNLGGVEHPPATIHGGKLVFTAQTWMGVLKLSYCYNTGFI